MTLRTAADLGQFVRAQRRKLGLTQAELAERAGVSRDWLVRLERGHHRLELGRVMRVVETLGYGLEPTAVEPRASGLLDTMLANTQRDD